MEPQTVTELRRQVARIKAAFAQALENRRNAENNRLQAILDREHAERELAAHATRETKSDLKNAKQKLKQATEEFETADKAFMTVYKQKIHLEDELKRAQERKTRNVR
nr:MAG TPA: hypothetical protein [Caudoviricetes sp.]